MQLGRPKNKEAERIIREILTKHPYINRHSLCIKYKEIIGKGVGFWTVDHALRKLIKEGIVEEIINNKTEKRITSIYYLADGLKRRI